MKSIGSMINQLEPLLGTQDLINQIARLEELYRKHFGDAEPA